MQKNHTGKILAIGIIVLFIGTGIHPVFAVDIKSTISDNESLLLTNINNWEHWTMDFCAFFGIIENLSEDNDYYYFYGKIIIGFGFGYSSLTGFTFYPEFGINHGCEIPKADFYGKINENYIRGILFNVSYHYFP